MFDPESWIEALSNAVSGLVEKALDAISNRINTAGGDAWTDITSALLNSPLNFLTRTPPELSYNLGSVYDLYSQWEPAFLGIMALSVLLAGLAVLGREVFAWSWTPSEWAGRMFLGVLLGGITPRLYAVSISLHNTICDAIAQANLPSSPNGLGNIDPLSEAVIVVVWVLLGLRLLWRMAYRLIYFDVLLIVGPIAMVCWVLPGGEFYARFWLRTYIGLLLGQVMVVICLRLAGAVGGLMNGNWAGLAMGIGVLLLAYDMATLFADIKGGGLGSILRPVLRAGRRLF
jgi:hypothetical protein